MVEQPRNEPAPQAPVWRCSPRCARRPGLSRLDDFRQLSIPFTGNVSYLVSQGPVISSRSVLGGVGQNGHTGAGRFGQTGSSVDIVQKSPIIQCRRTYLENDVEARLRTAVLSGLVELEHLCR